MIHFYLIRHGQTLLNRLERAQGWADSPLTAAGKQAAADLGQTLKAVEFAAVYTSDMLRAVQTAELILGANKNPSIPITVEPNLREWCLGNMEAELNSVFIQTIAGWLGGTASFPELNQRLPEIADAIYKHDTTGMAEPFSVIENRLKAVFQDAVQKYETQGTSNLLVVTHAFAIKTLFYLFTPEKLDTLGMVKNAAVSLLTFDRGTFSLEPNFIT